MSVFHNRSNMLIVSLICLCVGLFFVNSSAAKSKDTIKVVDVTASGVIAGNKIDSARQQVISGGLVSAVALACVDLLPMDAQVEYFEMLNQVLYDQVDEFVQDYKVLTEFMADSQYRVAMRVTALIKHGLVANT